MTLKNKKVIVIIPDIIKIINLCYKKRRTIREDTELHLLYIKYCDYIRSSKMQNFEESLKIWATEEANRRGLIGLIKK